MKQFFVVLVAVFLALSLSLSSFAAGEGVDPSDVTTGDSSGSSAVSDDLGEYIGTTVYSLSPVEASDSSGLKAVLLEFIGPYDAIVVEHAYQGSSGNTSYLREVQPDYVWLCSAALLVVMIFCLFRLGGAILCRK